LKILQAFARSSVKQNEQVSAFAYAGLFVFEAG